MVRHTAPDHSADELPPKRSRIETHEPFPTHLDDTEMDISIASESQTESFSHRKTLNGRASISNAADNIHFAKSRALIFHFVDVFDILQDELGRLESCVLRCGICHGGEWKWVKGGKSKGSTSNMLGHMRNKHPLIWQNALRADTEAFNIMNGAHAAVTEPTKQASIAVTLKESGFEIEEFYQRLTRWIVTGNQAFTEVENEEFQDLLIYLKPALDGHLLQSQAIRNRVFGHAQTLRNSTKQYLRSLPGLIAIACDAWTSSNRIAFLAIVGSWITPDWKLEETVLDFVELQGAHDGQNMAAAVASTASELGIEDKLVALVSDNANNNGTLIRHLSATLSRTSPRARWDGEKAHIRCLAHVIHLAVMCLLRGAKAIPQSTDIYEFNSSDHSLTSEEAEAFVAENNAESKESDDSTDEDPSVDLASAVDKIRKITKIVRSSPERMELFKANAESIEDYYEQEAMAQDRKYNRKKVKNLILDVPIRWNSVFLMLERALEFSEAIDALTSHPKVKIYHRYALTKAEWVAVSHLCEWLEFFRTASTMIAAEKYPTLSFSLHVYFILISYLSDLENSMALKQYPSISSGVSASKDKLLEFFDKSTFDSEYYYFATILDPRFKDTLFQSQDSATDLFSSEWVDDCANSLRDTCETFYTPEHPDPSQPDISSSFTNLDLGSKPTNAFSRAWHAHLRGRTARLPLSNSFASEIERYLREETATVSPLEWWRVNAHRFPRLAAMARDFLCIPGTSVAVERVFSSGRDVISVRRASLSAETIRTLMTYRAGILLEKRIGGFPASTH